VKLIFIILWFILVSLLLQAYFDPAHALISLGEVTGLLVRSILIVFGWYLFVGPIIMSIIKKILVNQQAKKKTEMKKVMELLPQTKYIFITGWQMSAKEKGLNRLRIFLKIALINILSETQ
jgi:hypothetical protein